jgi:hypothetical protein
MAREPYKQNVGRLEQDYPGWSIQSDGREYIAQQLSGRGRPGSRKTVRAKTLDGLAEKMDAAEAQ